MRLIILALALTGCATPQFELISGTYRLESPNPNHACRKIFGMGGDDYYLGCHSKVGDSYSYIIIPEKGHPEYAEVLEHELRHSRGWVHD